jgi:hypothetical protein
MDNQNNPLLQLITTKRNLIYFAVSIGLVIILIILSFITLRGQKEPVTQTPLKPTITPIPTSYTREAYNSNPDGTFRFTPYQKTEIGITTDEKISAKATVLKKSVGRSGETIYKVKSRAGNIEDEIRTMNGVVVFEKTRTIVNPIYGVFPKLSTYIAKFGQPEAIQPIGSPEDYIVAYIYSLKGFTLHLNKNTKTVYEILRYTPMTLAEYKTKYAEFLTVEKGEGHP